MKSSPNGDTDQTHRIFNLTAILSTLPSYSSTSNSQYITKSIETKAVVGKNNVASFIFDNTIHIDPTSNYALTFVRKEDLAEAENIGNNISSSTFRRKVRIAIKTNTTNQNIHFIEDPDSTKAWDPKAIILNTKQKIYEEYSLNFSENNQNVLKVINNFNSIPADVNDREITTQLGIEDNNITVTSTADTESSDDNKIIITTPNFYVIGQSENSNLGTITLSGNIIVKNAKSDAPDAQKPTFTLNGNDVLTTDYIGSMDDLIAGNLSKLASLDTLKKYVDLTDDEAWTSTKERLINLLTSLTPERLTKLVNIIDNLNITEN